MARWKALLTVLALSASTTALAEGFYVGAGLTLTQIEEPGFDDGFRVDDDPTGWRLTAGYAFNQYFALEGAYLDGGNADGAELRAGPTNGFEIPTDNELSGYSVALVGMLPLGSSADVFAKLGYFDGEQDIEISDTSRTVKKSENDLTLGGGVRFRVTDHFAVRGDVDWYDTDLDTLWSIGIGVEYRFGLD